MLRKKTGVLFTISSVNFELKQGPEPARPLSLSPPLKRLIASKIVFVHIIYVCTEYLYYVYINTC